MMFFLQFCKKVHKNVIYAFKRSIHHKFSHDNIIIMGIETSCDDTGCAVINNNGKILGESLHSQSETHIRYGGINPIIAHELHRDNIHTVVNEALKKADMDIKDIDAIAVTTKPGLVNSLQVGVKYAKFLAKTCSKPLIFIHHMEAHALVARMYNDIPFPYLVLLISGGHCLLAVAKDVDDFLLLGQSLDNAPGEVLDKIARRMKLRNIPAYSKMEGGKAIELAARKASSINSFEFPLPLYRKRDCNFSFSGLKDSLERKLQKKESEHGIIGGGVIPEVYDLCASFQSALTEHLIHRTERAMLFCDRMNFFNNSSKKLVVSGGVACNDFIFNSLKLIGDKTGYNIYRPIPKVCTDNGIMIAWNGLEKLKKWNYEIPLLKEEVDPVAPLGKNIINEVIREDLSVKATRLKTLFVK